MLKSGYVTEIKLIHAVTSLVDAQVCVCVCDI